MDIPFECEELKVLALLGDFAVLQNVDQVGVLDRAESMGDRDCRASHGRLVECELHDRFGLGVKRRGGLIEKED